MAAYHPHRHEAASSTAGSHRGYNSLMADPKYWLGEKNSLYADPAAKERLAYRTGEAPRIVTLSPQKRNRPRARRHRAPSSIYSSAGHPKLVTPASTLGRALDNDTAAQARAYADLLPPHPRTISRPRPAKKSFGKKLKGFFKGLSCF